jgi:hypothetical protein
MKFTATHLTILAIVVLIGFFGYSAYDAHLKNQPEVVYVPKDVINQVIDDRFETDSAVSVNEVEKIVEEIFLFDSVIGKPIVYEYQESTFKESGKSYWFFKADVSGKIPGKKGETYNGTNTRVIEMPYKFFNFEYAAKYLKENVENKPHNKKRNLEITHIFIEDFNQISEASYRSYSNYSKKY